MQRSSGADIRPHSSGPRDGPRRTAEGRVQHRAPDHARRPPRLAIPRPSNVERSEADLRVSCQRTTDREGHREASTATDPERVARPTPVSRADARLPASAGAAPGGAKQIDPALVKKLKDSARGSVTISLDEATQLRLVHQGGSQRRPARRATKARRRARPRASSSSTAASSVSPTPTPTSCRSESSTDKLGATHITYAQQYRGLPVFGGMLKVHVDAAGDLTAVNGTIVPAIDLAIDPRLERQAGEGQGDRRRQGRSARAASRRGRHQLRAESTRASGLPDGPRSRARPAAPTSSSTRSW